ncbi:MAG: hypothetical protein KDK08_05540 [Rhizobiaceae bacterium]|nr:hypothetical protein [Rhizobiaceae bacterium]MCC0000931.1 hypothetical protein [Methylobacteriaceae bacterium]
MDAQQILDTVYDHLVKQGGPALIKKTSDPTCAYRGVNNMSCAVGCLILDAEYSDDMEFTNVTGLKACGMLPERLLPHINLLKTLQNAHDTYIERAYGRFVRASLNAHFASIASGHGLSFTPAPEEEA